MNAIKRIKDLLRDWLPPACLRLARRLRRVPPPPKPQGPIIWDEEYPTWQEAASRCAGYDAPVILERTRQAIRKVKNGEAVFERDSVLFDKPQIPWQTLAALMWAAAQNNGRLNVLDFGGSLGSTYFQLRRFLAGLASVRWNVVEQTHVAQAGREEFQDAQLYFYDSIPQCLSETSPAVVLFSSVLQYLERPADVLAQATQSGAEFIVIDRTPVWNGDRHRLLIQRVPPEIYPASYPCWVFNETRLLAQTSPDYEVVADFGGLGAPDSAPYKFRGFLLRDRDMENAP